MIDKKTARPSSIIAPLALDASKELFPILQVAESEGDIEAASDLLKKVVQVAEFSSDNKKIWEVFQKTAVEVYGEDRAQSLIKWFYEAYPGQHVAAPNLSAWPRIINKFANAKTGWPDVGQTREEQAQIDEFSQFLLNEWDRQGFSDKLDAIEERYELTSWDQLMHEKFEWSYFDETGNNDPFLFLRGLNTNLSLRRAVKEFDFSSRPDFPLEKMRQSGSKYYEGSKNTNPEGWVLGTLMEIEEYE